jgi:hypothetical protein
LRIQVNVNHSPQAINGLLDACEESTRHVDFPGREAVRRKLAVREGLAA